MVADAQILIAWSRLVVSFLFLVVTWFVRRITGREDMAPFLVIGLVFILRDVVAMALPEPSASRDYVIGLAFSISLLLLIQWTGRYRTTNRSFAAAVAAFLICSGAAIYTGISSMVTILLPLILTALAGIAFFRIDRYVMIAATEVEGMRSTVHLMLGVSGVALLVLPFASGLFHGLVVFLTAFPFWTVVLALLARSIETLNGEIRFQRNATGHIFEFLATVGESFAEGGDPSLILSAAVDTIVGASGSDSGLGIIGVDGSYRVCAVKGVFSPPFPVPAIVKKKGASLRDYLLNYPVDEHTPLWGRALGSGKPLIISDAAADPFLRPHAVDPVLHLKSVIILPLMVRERVLGLISIARRENSRPFNEADLQRTGSMAGFVALTLDNHFTYLRLLKARSIERDVEIAGRIQHSFLAPNDLEGPHAEVAAESFPVRGVGGDYYDVVSLSRERTALIMCDVAGKGVPAALVMMIIRTAARLALEAADDAGAVLGMINSAVSGSLGEDRFATVSVVVLDPAHGKASFANAGHHPLIVALANRGNLVEEDTEGLPVGVDPDASYGSRVFSFPPGSWAVLYTDGIIEAVDPEGNEYGVVRLRSSIERALRSSPPVTSARSLLDRVIEDQNRFAKGAPQQDDLTLLVVRSRDT